MRWPLALILLLLCLPAAAQERGRDADAFVPTDFQAFGAWELYCGHFGDPRAEICDLRRTDILSPRPKFRAMVISWSYRDDRVRLDVGAERTTTWTGGGIKVDGALVVPLGRCVLGRCLVEDQAAAALRARVVSAGTKRVALAFTDVLAAKEIDWDLADLRRGLAALEAKWRKRP
jgi:hypothetical protein